MTNLTVRNLPVALRCVLCFGGLLSVLANPASAQISSTTGAMTEIFAPVSLLEGDTESSSTIYILDEGFKILSADIVVNAFGPGTHGASVPPMMTIPMGSPVRTYIVHFDPVGGGFATLTGAVFFSPGETILGVQTHTPLLDAADPIVGAPMVIYPTGLDTFRAFETLPGIDGVTLPLTLDSASFTLFAELGVDQARIVTIPEPSTLMLCLLGALGVARWASGRRV